MQPTKLIVAAIPSLTLVTAASGTTWYVDDTAPYGGTGQGTFDNAFRSLQDALGQATEDDEIWVAQGVYVPAATGQRQVSFVLDKHGLRLLGGFAGYGAPDPNERDVDQYETILTGDIDGDHVLNTGNSLHVVYILTPGLSDPVVIDDIHLDGFTITGGYADGPGQSGSGGGIFIGGDNWNEASPRITDCTIRDNYAMDGGGIYVRGLGELEDRFSEPQIRDCDLYDNEAEDDGGAIRSFGRGTKPRVILCDIHDNVAGEDGGGVAWVQGEPEIVNCVIRSNTARSGGGVAFIGADPAAALPTMINSRISGNLANWRGGGVWVIKATTTVVNCTIYGNQAGTGGGGYAESNHEPAGQSRIANSILWDNTSTTGGAQLDVQVQSGGPFAFLITHSDVKGGQEAIWDPNGIVQYEFNTELPPQLVDPTNGLFDLQAQSPCIDVGSHDQIAPFTDQYDVDDDGNGSELTPDLAKDLRERGCNVDMGAFEFVPDCVADIDGDLEVGFNDLLQVLELWGPCAGCPADVDGDGEVGFLDLLAVLSGWGPCGCPTGTAPQSVMDCIARYGFDPERLTKCIEAMVLAGTP